MYPLLRVSLIPESPLCFCCEKQRETIRAKDYTVNQGMVTLTQGSFNLKKYDHRMHNM